MSIKYKWTLIFLVQALDNSAEDMKKMMEDITTANINEHISVLIAVTLNKNRDSNYFAGQDSSISAISSTLFYELEVGVYGPRLHLLMEDEHFRLYDENKLLRLFNELVFKKYAAERYLVFTWDHGHPFGIFEPVQNISPEHYLNISSLKNVIDKSIKKIDVLVMNNCFCQFFDTGFELKDNVDFLLAFETDMYFKNTFDYPQILNSLADDHEKNSRELAVNIVDGFKRVNEYENTMDRIGLFANDLSYYGALGNLIDQLGRELLNGLNDYSHLIISAIGDCNYLSPNRRPYYITDLINFINILKTKSEKLISSEIYEQLKCSPNKTIVNSFTGRYTKAIAPSAFSIYLPFERGYKSTRFYKSFMDKNASGATRFSKSSRWIDFIDELENHFP